MFKLIFSLLTVFHLQASDSRFSWDWVLEEGILHVRLDQIENVPQTHRASENFKYNATKIVEEIGYDWRNVRVHVSVSEDLDTMMPEYKQVLFNSRLRNYLRSLMAPYKLLAKWLLETYLLERPALHHYLNLLIEVESQCVFLRDHMPGGVHPLHKYHPDDLANKANNQHYELTSLTEKSLRSLLPMGDMEKSLCLMDFSKSFINQFERSVIREIMGSIYPTEAPNFTPDPKTKERLELEDDETLLDAFDKHIESKTDELQRQVDELYAKIYGEVAEPEDGA